MLFEERTVFDWASYEPNKFAQEYSSSEFVTLRNYLEHRIRNDSIRILRRLDLSETVFFQVRQKKAASLLNKIIKIGTTLASGKPVLLSRRTGDTLLIDQKYHLFDIVKDVVGIRYICLDSSARDALLSTVLRSESIAIKDSEIYQPFFREYDGDKADNALALIASISNGAPSVISKPSNYESIHLEVYFNAPVDRFIVQKRSGDRSPSRGYSPGDSTEKDPIFDLQMEIQEDLSNKLTPNVKADLSPFSMEMQIRTFSQHIWAQDEHKYIYSLVKTSVPGLDNDLLEQTRSAFTGLKFFLSASDSIRDLIRTMHTKQTGKLGMLDAKAMEITSRLQFFNDANFSSAKARLIELDRKTSDFTQRRRSGKPSDADFYKVAIKELHDIATYCEKFEQNYFSKSHGGVFSYWGRQRVFAMILGFIFLFCLEEELDPQTETPDGKAGLRDFLLEMNLDTLLGTLITDPEYKAFPHYSANLAARTYEYIKINDRYFLDYGPDSELSKFSSEIFDPLVFARHATALYRIGEFSGAYRALREFFDSSNYNAEYWADPSHKGHSEVELRCRLLQYYWYKAALDADAIASSLAGLEQLIRELDKAIQTSAKKSKKDVVTSLSWMIWIYGILQALHIPIGETIEERFRHHVKLIEGSDPGKLVENKVYYHAARSVILLKREQIAAADEQLEKANAIAALGIPHPISAVAIQKKMLTLIEGESKRSKFVWELFVSYAGADLGFAKSVVDELNTHKISIFFDQEKMSHGLSVTPVIEDGLRGSRNILMLVTKEYMNRKWPDVERVWFATQESWVGERKFLIVLKDASRKEFQNRYPTLADRHIIEFPTKSRPTVTELARDIAAALRTGPSRNG